MYRAPAVLSVLAMGWLGACDSGRIHQTGGPEDLLRIVTESLPDATAGVLFVHSVQSDGGAAPVAFQWSGAVAPPSWLNLSTEGALYGTPPAPGAWTLSVLARDAATPSRVAQATFHLAVQPAPLQVATQRLPAAVFGMPYDVTIGVTGGCAPYQFRVTAGGTAIAGGHKLGPTQMAMDAAGRITGVCNAGGELLQQFQFEVQDSSNPPALAVGALDLWVIQPPAITSTELPRGMNGQPYGAQAQSNSSLGAYPLTWSATSALPSGLTMHPDGALVGVPTMPGLYEVSLRCVPNTSPPLQISRELDLVIYEGTGYVHAPDKYDGGANNNTPSDATHLGPLAMGAPLVEAAPCSLTSNPADPAPDPADFFSFDTPHTGEIEAEIYFSAFVGKLKAALYRRQGALLDRVAECVPGPAGDDLIARVPGAEAGEWFIGIEAVYKNLTWNANGYMFRIRFNDLTLTGDLVEHDTALGAMQISIPAAIGGVTPTGATFTLASGSLPQGVTLGSSGVLHGWPMEFGLFDFTVEVAASGLTAVRAMRVRVYDSVRGDYWLRAGDHRYYSATQSDGAGAHHEHYCESMVVAPHPDYGPEGAIYVLGGRVDATVASVHVFHTKNQPLAARDYRLENINRSLSSERQYLGAAFLQHTYGGYVYVVGGELYSNTAPSSGGYCTTVERMQVSDASGVALSVPGVWEPVASLPANLAGRSVEGWAEFGLVASDGAADHDDRLYLIGGRLKIETLPGSGSLIKEYNDTVLMFEAPPSAATSGAWHVKTDVAPYTPRRFPTVGWISGAIYLVGGRGVAGTLDTIEMYRPDPVGSNPALSAAGAHAFPRLAQPVWHAAGAMHGGQLYILNGWDSSPAPKATARLQRFDPVTGTVELLSTPDAASGFHSGVFHDGKMWFVTGRDSFAPTPKFSLYYTP